MLDFGFSRVLQSDGARVFTGEEFQKFLENNKIEHRLLIAVIDFCTVSGSHSAASGDAHSQYIGEYLLGFCVKDQSTAAFV